MQAKSGHVPLKGMNGVGIVQIRARRKYDVDPSFFRDYAQFLTLPAFFYDFLGFRPIRLFIGDLGHAGAFFSRAETLFWAGDPSIPLQDENVGKRRDKITGSLACLLARSWT